MENKHIDILLKEYEIVNQHWMLATKQKAVIIQVLGSIIIALIGAAFLGHIDKSLFYLTVPLLSICGSFIYIQKEADYWAAAICLESIEKLLNKEENKELLVYAHKFKNILFKREDIFSLSPIRFLQILRVLPLAGFMLFCTYKIYIYYPFIVLLVIVFLQLLTIFFIYYSWHYVRGKACEKMEDRLISMTT